MASLIISSAAVTAVSRATSSQARQVVVPFNGTKLSNSISAVTQTHSLVAAPFTGLKSNSTFPMSRKVDNITSLSSNGGRAKCSVTDGPLPITVATPGSWITNKNDGSIEFNGGNLKNWVEVDVSALNRGKNYQVIYYVTMRNQTVTGYFTLTADFPNYTSKVLKKDCTVMQGVQTAVYFDDFRQDFNNGKIKFTFDSDNPSAWVGLIIVEAIIISLN